MTKHGIPNEFKRNLNLDDVPERCRPFLPLTTHSGNPYELNQIRYLINVTHEHKIIQVGAYKYIIIPW